MNNNLFALMKVPTDKGYFSVFLLRKQEDILQIPFECITDY